MKLHYCDWMGRPNFGDDLNPWLWNRLLPGVFDDRPESIFVGIGTLLNERLPRAGRTVVFGSGAGHGQRPPVVDESWTIYCLRGPLSVKSLGVAPHLAVTDPAALVRRFVPVSSDRPHRFAYMPHAYHANEGWRAACERAGMTYIDPCRPVDQVFALLGKAACLVTEAMHGAIVADALRVPWIPVHTDDKISTFKWTDWCESLGLTYRPNHLPPMWETPKPGWISRARHWTKIRLVASQLKWITRTARPSLSGAARLEKRTAELEWRLQLFQSDLAAGRFGAA